MVFLRKIRPDGTPGYRSSLQVFPQDFNHFVPADHNPLSVNRSSNGDFPAIPDLQRARITS
jgi:hypothetical protein